MARPAGRRPLASRLRHRALAAGMGLAVALGAATSVASAATVSFVALGDMPYGPEITTGPAYRQLIDQINDEALPFSIHVGDFKDGVTECSDALYARQAAYFQRYASAVVYTPGDNDWYDCARRGESALERLKALRARFFGTARSLGRQPMPVQRQADEMPGFAAYTENQRWWQSDVLFATFHTVGPDNGRSAGTPVMRAAWRDREAANAAWISAAFALARERKASALVLATQADVLRYPRDHRVSEIGGGFEASFRDTLLPLAADAPFPVLLIHGDSHHFMWDQPFRTPAGQAIGNLWRLQVFGDPQMHAVRVRVNAAARPPFEVSPIWNPMSPDPRR